LSDQASQVQQSPESAGRPAATLDPYRNWLGLRTAERPPSHYALLGLPELENNLHAINAAARKAKKTVRSYQIGKFRKEALGLMTEIGQAVDVLTAVKKKRAYDDRRLQAALERAEQSFPQADMDRPLEELLTDWLTECAATGLPVVQVLPQLMQWCLSRAFKWPPRGEHELPLPLGLWIYYDAALVAQCVARNPMEQRGQAVKRIQQALGISEQLSRLVIIDIFRRPAAFAETEQVLLAADRPRDLLQQWVDRMAAQDAAIDQESPTFSTLAFLLGLVEEDGQPIAEPVKPQIVVAEKPSPLVLLWDDVRDRADVAMDFLLTLAARYPEYMPAARVAVMIAGAIVLLILVILLLSAAL